MEQIAKEQLHKTILLWIGWKKASSPLRDDGMVLKEFGTDGEILLDQMKALEDDFYKSDAYQRLSNLGEMETETIKQFCVLHPETTPTIIPTR